MIGCLSDETVSAFVQGRLEPAGTLPVEQHLAECGDCRRVVADTLESLPGRMQEDAALKGGEASPNVVVSRYRAGDIIGAGGAGVVYRAHDPQLGRDVALKVIWSVLPDALISQERILREARAMARLSHPNVVNVFDAGTHDGHVFVVMELVEGPTLRAWLRERKRSRREILDVFLAAGRGLAAAHAAGLVHRDFKPDNVLIGSDGRARVTDFGLAADSEALTGQRATLMGTPAYMPPEQFLGRSVDARGDQFSFCVALHEGLAGVLRPVPRGHRLPRWLHEVLVRGLQQDPGARYASMDELLDRIQRSRGGVGARNPVRAVVLVAIVAAIGVGAIWRHGGARRALEPGVVAAVMVCGNGIVERAEECDDGNLINSDACTSLCQVCRGGDAHFTAAETGRCYTRHDTGSSWEAAFSACRHTGGHLVSLDSLAETRAIQKQLGLRPDAWYWVGLRDPFSTGVYKWETGTPMVAFADWLGRASPVRGGCASVTKIAPDVGTLGDLLARDLMAAFPCTQPLGFLCERSAWLTRAETGHAYRAYYREPSWAGARRLCEAVGAHLATVTDAGEAAFVGASFAGTFWLGGVKHSAQEDFTWVTGEPFTPRAFGEDDPNEPVFPACVVQADDGTLRDRSCDNTFKGPYGALCEIE